MNVGDLVNWLDKTGVIIRVYKHKVWRTNERGSGVDWNKVAPEPFADVMVNGSIMRLPQSDLAIVR